MYSHRVLDKIRQYIQDKDILAEISQKFKPYDHKLLSNIGRSRGIQPEGFPGSPLAEIANLPSEVETAEAIIMLFGRPALLVQNQTFEMPLSEVWQKRLEPVRSHINAAIRAVGRIELKKHPYMNWVGTGWITHGNILVTNRHVAQTFATKKAENWVFRQNLWGDSMEAFLDLLEEYQSPAEDEIKVTEILYIASNDEPDVAFLRINRDNVNAIDIQSYFPQDGMVAAIGYPAFDFRNDPAAMSQIFHNIYDVKRFQPGFIVEQYSSHIFGHDCSTLGGNSGSPILDPLTGKAVGLHFGGTFMEGNYAVSGQWLEQKLEKILGKSKLRAS